MSTTPAKKSGSASKHGRPSHSRLALQKEVLYLPNF
jgi:hypothetical protein